MGHIEKPKTLEHRDALVLRRRIATFLLAFSVGLVALMMTLAALQSRDAGCQDRAHEVMCDNLLRPDLTKENILSVITEILLARKAALDVDTSKTNVVKVKTLEVLDTPTDIIAANGFRLLRRSDGSGNFRFELRALFDQLCGSKPTISMEVMPNVDYEKVFYHTKAVALTNGTRRYVLESALGTKDATRILTFAQLQSIFPGFHRIDATAKLTVRESWTYAGRTYDGQVYYNGAPLDMTVGIQQWMSKDDKPLFWRVVTSTENVYAEADLSSLEQSLRKGFASSGYSCTEKTCTDTFNMYLR